MKRCPKCSRTFPDENQKFCTVDGGLLVSDQPAFDPNLTIRATSSELHSGGSDLASEKATSRELPDRNATIAAMSVAPTVAFSRNTGPTSAPISAELPASAVPQAPAPLGSVTLPSQKKKSKLPWILGALALILLLGLAGAAGLFFFVIQPRLAELTERRVVTTEPTPAEESNTNSNANNTNTAATEATPEAAAFVPPSGTVKFANSKDRLEGKLAEHYIDFSFYYPENWQVDQKAGVPGASNFAKVERRLPPDFTQENFAVGWYTSKGTFEADQPAFPQLVELLGANLAKSFPEYRKVSEGPTKINSMDAYEFRFSSLSKGTEKGDLQLWGRVVFLPTGVAGQPTGATLIMLSTSLAPELSGVGDVGEKGEMPVILESFRFGKN
jgi:hypothetical protein